MIVRACEAAGVTEAVVPRGFPLEAAEAMTAAGIAVHADGAGFDQRRRAKTPAQVAGIRRAQRACESAMEAVRAALRRDGVTSEDLHAAIAHAFVDAGMIPTPAIASHGAAGRLRARQRLGPDPARASRSSSTSSRSTRRPAATRT